MGMFDNIIIDANILPDLTQEENQKSCFHYTNTQPLTILQNQQKSNKIYK